MKRTYQQPKTRCYRLHAEAQIMQGSGEPNVKFGTGTLDGNAAMTQKKHPIWGGEDEEETGF